MESEPTHGKSPVDSADHPMA
jgi:mitogen-activated protein kinase 1/3